jgi:hypothetical protein
MHRSPQFLHAIRRTGYAHQKHGLQFVNGCRRGFIPPQKEDRFVGAHIAAAERDHRMSLERQSVVTARPAYRKSDDVTVLFARRPRITGAVTLPKCE